MESLELPVESRAMLLSRVIPGLWRCFSQVGGLRARLTTSVLVVSKLETERWVKVVECVSNGRACALAVVLRDHANVDKLPSSHHGYYPLCTARCTRGRTSTAKVDEAVKVEPKSSGGSRSDGRQCNHAHDWRPRAPCHAQRGTAIDHPVPAANVRDTTSASQQRRRTTRVSTGVHPLATRLGHAMAN